MNESLSRHIYLEGQSNGKYGSLAQLGIYLYSAAMFFDKFAGDHQTESGAAMSFGAEKRSKQLFQNLFIHAGAVVADLKFYDITRFLGCFKPDLQGYIRVFIK